MFVAVEPGVLHLIPGVLHVITVLFGLIFVLCAKLFQNHIMLHIPEIFIDCVFSSFFLLKFRLPCDRDVDVVMGQGRYEVKKEWEKSSFSV